METEEVVYNWILAYKAGGHYLGWSKAEAEPPCGEPDKLEWVQWGKGLPEDIGAEGMVYRLIDGKLVKE